MKMKESICIVCETTFSHPVKKGRQPKLCTSSECRSAHRKATRKPKPRVVRKQKCAGCENTITKHGRGRIKWCDECREKLKVKHREDYRKKTYVPKTRTHGNCTDCGCDMGEKSGRGKLRVRCTECQKKHRRMIARKSARKCYTPSKRDYTCNVCKDVFTQEGRGKLRKKCPTCLEVKSNSSTYTPEVDKEAETMLKDMGL